MRSSAFVTIIFLAWRGLFGAESESGLALRTPFTVPLAKLSVGRNPATKLVDRVRIAYVGDRRQYIVTSGNDAHIETTRGGKRTHVHAEVAGAESMLTAFEAEQLDKVSTTLARTLEVLSADIRRGAWDRCRYLDAYLPRFLNGFYHLYCAARNSPRALPRVADIPDDAYDVSLNSPISDRRIAAWMADPQYAVRLRIITGELIFQIKQWQKIELRNRKKNPDAANARTFEMAYEFFVRMYFNLRPEPLLPAPGEHL